MKFLLTNLIICIACTVVKGQRFLTPGGIGGAVVWYVADTSKANPGLISQLPGNLPVRSPLTKTTSLNFHSALQVGDQDQLSIKLNNYNLSGASYFTAYQSGDTTNEYSIWHTTKNFQTQLVFTTDRMADLSTYKYMNYIDRVRSNPKVNIYVQQKDSDSISTKEQTWYIGSKPLSPQLPIRAFKGLVSEVIAYDRALNSQERLQVASYLALKYGITLTEPGATYLNSNGDKIWDGTEYETYHHNIAGMARDDSAGTNQTRATSSNIPNLLTIYTHDSLKNYASLLWGDNGQSLTLENKIPGVPDFIQKKWLMISHGLTDILTTDILLDTKKIDATITAQPVYWIAIDRSGKGDFSSAETEFKKMDLLDANGFAHFNKVEWNKSSSGREVFGFIPKQDLLLSTIITNPSCKKTDAGSLQVKVLGGLSPFKLTVKNNIGKLISQQTSSGEQTITISAIPAGKYILQILDATLQQYTDSFYINNTDAPQPSAVADNYVLKVGEMSLNIDAAEGMPDGVSYEWTGANNFQSFKSKVSITKGGIYTLTCSKDGCSYQQEIMVKAPPENLFQKIVLYPNPSQGQFTTKITLEKVAPVNMAIYNSDGKLITTKKMNGFANYSFTSQLNIHGEYKVVFWSGLFSETKKLVIIK